MGRQWAWLCGAALWAGPTDAQERPRVVDEGGLRAEWTLVPGVPLAAPQYPAEFAARADDVCIALAYAVNPDGTTSDFSLVKGWTSSTAGAREPVPGFWPASAQAGAAALSQWRFAPRPEVAAPQKTVTVATMLFTGRGTTDPTALRAHCAVRNLSALLTKLKREAASGSMARSEAERLSREQRAPMR